MSVSRPLPPSAETVTSETPFTCGSNLWHVSRSSFRRFSRSRTRSHLLTAMTSARPSWAIRSAICEILLLERLLGVEQQHDHLGEADRLQSVADRKLLGAALDPHLAAKPGGVEQEQRAAVEGELERRSSRG